MGIRAATVDEGRAFQAQKLEDVWRDVVLVLAEIMKKSSWGNPFPGCRRELRSLWQKAVTLSNKGVDTAIYRPDEAHDDPPTHKWAQKPQTGRRWF